eukprot:TRINITY_DN5262_c0_g1_i1.p1 TRINITY_DN5262_c0_g1~~TRINITY_DN5262_c0_g1_i1.p1  ORF type:complete len:370 (+),score=102.77 TRINITY_DN5262_c0_g1_i1:100-1209(+)
MGILLSRVKIKDMEQERPKMEYRNLGPSGLKVSVLSYGNWVTSNANAQETTNELVKRCWDLGINFFDTAEAYGAVNGEGEILLGNALKNLNVPRDELVVSTKIFFGGSGVNARGLSRKHVIEAGNNCLRRLQLDYADVIFCHRYDLATPIEEIVHGMNWLINSNKWFYWGTSEWSADEIRKAHAICERYGLIKPIVEQPQYNMIIRDKVESEFDELFEDFGLGTTVWSPLAGGILTGKYRGEVPEGSRLDTASEMVKSRMREWVGPENKEKTNKTLNSLEEIARSLGGSLPQLALAWIIYNKDISTAIFGASRVSQIEDNIGALNLYRKLTPELDKQINEILGNQPKPAIDYKNWAPKVPRRNVGILKK